LEAILWNFAAKLAKFYQMHGLKSALGDNTMSDAWCLVPDACYRSSSENPSFKRFPGSRIDLSFVSSINFRILLASKMFIFLSFISLASSAAL
jgi:hypothetical protein